MYVQNGERPRWAWSGLKVEAEAAPAAPEADDLAPPAGGSVEVSARPSWAWGGERAAEPDPLPAAPMAPAAPEPAVIAVEVSAHRPAWSWGGPAA